MGIYSCGAVAFTAVLSAVILVQGRWVLRPPGGLPHLCFHVYSIRSHQKMQYVIKILLGRQKTGALPDRGDPEALLRREGKRQPPARPVSAEGERDLLRTGDADK